MNPPLEKLVVSSLREFCARRGELLLPRSALRVFEATVLDQGDDRRGDDEPGEPLVVRWSR